MEREKTTVWHATSTQLAQLVQGGRLERHDLGALRSVRFFGERMAPAILRVAMDRLPRARFQCRYGASEAFALTAYDLPRPLPADLVDMPLGETTGCFELSLRDEAGNEVAPGETGEICAIGPAALVGYWKRPDLTAAVRLAGMANSYRTGDLAFVDPDGNYHFAGRRDHQVKIRGHRFELGEIEAVLKSQDGVRDAVAFLAVNDRGTREVRACVLSDRGESILDELTATCLRRLPAFARPARIAVMDRFPMLGAGKVDRLALQRMGA